MPNVSALTKRANYLTLVDETAWSTLRSAASSSHAFTVSFWVNAKTQREKNFNSYWGAMFTGYTPSGGTTTEGVWDEATMKSHAFGPALCTAGQFRYYNCADGTNYGDITYNADNYRDGIVTWQDNDDWHHFAFVFANLDQKTFTLSCYLDGNEKYVLNEEAYANGLEMLNNIDRFVIGGSTPHWNDPDNAYAYDEIKIYSEALTAEQITKIISDKKTLWIPEPVYFNDFSSTDGLIQVGSGEFVSDVDPQFGKIYHNNPDNNQTPRTNYLKLPADVLTHSGTTKEMTIGFWVNAKTAIGYNFFHSPVFSAYASSTPGADNGSPMFRCSAKGVMQLNDGRGNWSNFDNEQNDKDANT